MQKEIIDDIEALLNILPEDIRKALAEANRTEELLEVVLDLGRLPEARFSTTEVTLSQQETTHEDLEIVASRTGEFGEDNRAGIERTLHRISAIRNRKGRIVGLTCRIGRAVYGTVDIIRDIVESGKNILLLGRPGVGKCVTADTWILTDKGLLTLGSLVPAEIEDDTFVEQHVQLATQNGLEETSHVYSGGYSSTLRIVTGQGFAIEGTHEHRILTLNAAGKLAFCRLDALQEGDYIAIRRGQKLFGSTTRLPAFDFTPHTNAPDCRLPTEVTPALGRFLGYVVAGRGLHDDHQITLSHTDAGVQNEMESLTEELFGLKLRHHRYQGEWNGQDFRLFGVQPRQFLAHLGLGYGRAAGKRVPDCILSAPASIVAEFLSAYFEGSGSVYPSGRIQISSDSERLLHQVQILLLNYGIVSRLRRQKNLHYDRASHTLELLGEEVAHFAREIGFRSLRKRRRLSRVVKKCAEQGFSPNLDVIPHINDLLRTLRSESSNTDQMLDRYCARDNRYPSYRSLGNILAITHEQAHLPAYQHLADLYEQRFFFDRVAEIEPGEDWVYDLTVPGSHTFFANGFVSHNTTMLREVARILAEHKRVVVVDTSNEIAGDGDIPHPAIGRARRMQVPTPSLQHEVMIEAVENHMPEVIIIDEIGRQLEAEAARTIAERGVQLIGTAHGNTLDNLMMNPTLCDLVGGIQAVTLSDEEARRRGTQKSVLERKAPPTFEVVVEIQDWQRLAVRHDVATAVDAILRGRSLPAEIRYRDDAGEIHREEAVLHPSPEAADSPASSSVSRWDQETAVRRARTVRLFPYGISQNRLKQAARSLQLPILIVHNEGEAEAVITLRSYYRKRPPVITNAERRGVPVYVLRSNTVPQIEQCLLDIYSLDRSELDDPHTRAIEEAQTAIERIASGGARSVELSPQNAYVRRLQHQQARDAQLLSRSRGKEPRRRVRIYANDVQL